MSTFKDGWTCLIFQHEHTLKQLTQFLRYLRIHGKDTTCSELATVFRKKKREQFRILLHLLRNEQARNYHSSLSDILRNLTLKFVEEWHLNGYTTYLLMVTPQVMHYAVDYPLRNYGIPISSSPTIQEQDEEEWCTHSPLKRRNHEQ